MKYNEQFLKTIIHDLCKKKNPDTPQLLVIQSCKPYINTLKFVLLKVEGAPEKYGIIQDF